VSATTSSIDWADFDGDGDLDVAYGVRGDSNLIFQNDGDGQFVEVWASTDTMLTTSVAWGDYDNDGDPDLAVGNDSEANQIFENDDGLFVLVWASTETDATEDVAWGDPDADNDLDLAVANMGAEDRLYINNGWAPTVLTYPTPSDSHDLAWGDLTGDGSPDLVVGGGLGHESSVLTWDSTTGTMMSIWSSLLGERTYTVALGDKDGDGALDVFFGNFGTNDLLYVNGGYNSATQSLSLSPDWSSSAATFTTSSAFGDIDSNGALDIAIGTSLFHPLQAFYPKSPTSGPNWSSTTTLFQPDVALGDFDNTGGADLAAAAMNGADSIYFSERRGMRDSFTVTDTNKRFDVAWGDWDNDGDLDLAAAVQGGSGTDEVYVNTGGALALGWQSAATTSSSSLAWGDWDNDGDLDLVVGGGDLNGCSFSGAFVANTVYENQGSNLVPVWTSPNQDCTTDVAWGDWDGDGDLDLAEANFGAPVRIYENDSSASTPAARLTIGWTAGLTQDSMALAWGDYDDDGDLDLAVANMSDTDRLYGNPSNGSMVLDWQSTSANAARDVEWGDWDGDGSLDLLVANYGDPVGIHLNGVGGLDPAPTVESLGAYNTESMALEDWDADGDLDIAIALTLLTVAVLENPGNGLPPQIVYSSPFQDPTHAVSWGDFDGDGDPDLGTSGTLLRVKGNEQNPLPQLPQNPPTAKIHAPVAATSTSGHAVANPATGPDITIDFDLTDPESDPTGEITVTYQELLGGPWLPASVTGVTSGLEASPAGSPHTLIWHARDDGVESNSVRVRMHIPGTALSVAAPIQQVGSVATSNPFPVVGCTPFDGDTDGFSCYLDCDDSDPLTYPGATEIADDGIDQDCNDYDTISCFEDLDQDGAGSNVVVFADDGDCDDPAAFEADNNDDCDDSDSNSTFISDDNDCDGTLTAQDCDDNDPVSTIVATDADCDGVLTAEDCNDTDASLLAVANDGDCDGVLTGDDCDDTDLNSTVIADDGDCDGVLTVDDCDDTNPDVNPSATEICNGLDDDCDPSNDEVTDYDEDNFSLCDGDCLEGDATAYPGAPELCDGVDNDCDPETTEDETDADADSSRICDGECDDTNADIYPGAPLLCDGVDNDCDPGTLEPEDIDADGDGVLVCAGDCDDESADIYLGADEVCGDGIDQDCNGAEQAVGKDPRCWEDSRLGCSSTLSGARSAPASLAFLCVMFGLIGRGRRRRSHTRAPAGALAALLFLAPALLLTSPTTGHAGELALIARAPAEIKADIQSGNCDKAQAEAKVRTQVKPDSIEDHKLLGDAARCANDPRQALVAYRTYLALGGKDPSVSSILPSLSSLLATVAVTMPLGEGLPAPMIHVVSGDDVAEGILDVSGSGVVPDVRTGVPVELVVHGPGWTPIRIPVEALASAEVRPIEVTPEWAGKAAVAVTGFDDAKLSVMWSTSIGLVELTPNSSVEVTAGDVAFEVINPMGRQEVQVQVPADSTFEFNPASWAAAELRVAGVPVGSEVRVFVEGHDGTFMERAGQAETEGELDTESGVVFAPPVVLQSLVSGAGGLFVTHPLLGEGVGQVVLAPGASNSTKFKWQEMPGVPGVRDAWTEWHQVRKKHESFRKTGKIAGIAMAVGSGVASGIFWALAASSSAAADRARQDGVLAGDSGDVDLVQQKWNDHEAALQSELGFAVGGSIAAGLSGAGLGLTLSFDHIGAKKIADHGEWSMRVPAAPAPPTDDAPVAPEPAEDAPEPAGDDVPADEAPPTDDAPVAPEPPEDDAPAEPATSKDDVPAGDQDGEPDPSE